MKAKRTLMAVILTGIVALLAGAVMASSSRPVTSGITTTGNTFTAGTLDMKIADSNEGWKDDTPVTASWKSPAGWAPGETFTTGVIRLHNVGSIDIRYLFTTYYNYHYTKADLANVIKVVEYWEYVPGYGWLENATRFETQVGDFVAPLTLKELIVAWHTGDTTRVDYCTGWDYDPIPEGKPAIPVGGIYQTKLTLEFMETAGNAYQGASCSFDIEYEGVQNLSQVH